MGGVEAYRGLSPRDLRLELEALYAAYAGCLDEERFEAWPDFFADDCLYRIVPRENFERGLPLSTWLCEGRGYLEDRVTAIRRTSIYAPRLIRRMITGIQIHGWADDLIEVRANYAAFETLLDELTRVFNVGRYQDRIAVENGTLKFKEKICIFDSMLVPNSLIYPL
jgi:3-phenylpropionate/cinnamic acid dioxygenase small subunit